MHYGSDFVAAMTESIEKKPIRALLELPKIAQDAYYCFNIYMRRCSFNQNGKLDFGTTYLSLLQNLWKRIQRLYRTECAQLGCIKVHWCKHLLDQVRISITYQTLLRHEDNLQRGTRCTSTVLAQHSVSTVVCNSRSTQSSYEP